MLIEFASMKALLGKHTRDMEDTLNNLAKKL